MPTSPRAPLLLFDDCAGASNAQCASGSSRPRRLGRALWWTPSPLPLERLGWKSWNISIASALSRECQRAPERPADGPQSSPRPSPCTPKALRPGEPVGPSQTPPNTSGDQFQAFQGNRASQPLWKFRWQGDQKSGGSRAQGSPRVFFTPSRRCPTAAPDENRNKTPACLSPSLRSEMDLSRVPSTPALPKAYGQCTKN